MILKAVGAKTKVAAEILRRSPSSYAEFREPFAYSAGVYWRVPTDKRRWISDLNPVIAKLYTRLRDDPTFIDEILSLKSKLLTADDKELAFNIAKWRYWDHQCPLSFLLLSRYAYYQIVDGNIGVHRRKIACFDPHYIVNGLRPITRERLEQARDILQGTRIACADYRDVLHADGEDAFCFIDPPYHARRLYQFSFVERDYYELADHLRQCRHKFLMTIGADDLSRSLFQNDQFNVDEYEYVGSLLSVGRGRRHKELWVRNY